MNLEDYFRKGKVITDPKKYSIAKVKKITGKYFAAINDRNENTIVIPEDQIQTDNILAINKNWRLITFDLVLPFSLVGFLAKISASLAKAKISVFVLSSYSTDHILVRNKDLKSALQILSDLGFEIKK